MGIKSPDAISYCVRSTAFELCLDVSLMVLECLKSTDFGSRDSSEGSKIKMKIFQVSKFRIVRETCFSEEEKKSYLYFSNYYCLFKLRLQVGLP